MKRLLRAIVIAAVIVLLALSLLYSWRARPENAIVVAPGGELRYDDVAFSVEGVRRQRSLGEGVARVAARGEFVIVTLGVHNHAQRVDYSFRPEIVRLVVEDSGAAGGAAGGQPGAAAGTEFAAAPGTAPVLAEANGCAAPIPAGASCTIELAFDVPVDTRGLRIRMQFAGSILDALDTVIHGRMSLALPE